MKIAVFYPTGIWGSAWSVQKGIVTTLKKMGHKVLDCPIDFGEQQKIVAPFTYVESADLVLLSAIEFIHTFLQQHYGVERWKKISHKCTNLYTESLHRDDANWNHLWLKQFAKVNVFPAIQDAEEAGGHYLPFGVDTDMFYAECKPIKKIYDAAFLGTMYQKRLGYIESVGFPIQHVRAPVMRHTDGRYDIDNGTKCLREVYNQIKVFVNLPAYSRLMTTKVFEVMACGVFLLTPHLDHPSAIENEHMFDDEHDLVFYDPNNPTQLGNLIRYYLENEDVRQEIARQGMQYVRQEFSLENRMKKILELAC